MAIAILPGDDFKDAAGQWGKTYPRHKGDGVAFVSTRALHMTVLGLGEFSGEKLQRATDLLTQATFETFSIAYEGMTIMPSLERNSNREFLWVNARPSPSLMGLAAYLQDQCKAAGLDTYNPSDFRPHIKIAERKGSPPKKSYKNEWTRFARRHARLDGALKQQPVTEIALIHGRTDFHNHAYIFSL